jgi:hypothetical protein
VRLSVAAFTREWRAAPEQSSSMAQEAWGDAHVATGTRNAFWFEKKKM